MKCKYWIFKSTWIQVDYAEYMEFKGAKTVAPRNPIIDCIAQSLITLRR